MIDGACLRSLRVIPDERGFVMEIFRSDDPEFEAFGQVYLSVVYPGVVKGWHYHQEQTDHFCVVRGMAKVVLYDRRQDSRTRGEVNEFFLGDRNPAILTIPKLVLHGAKGVGVEPAYVINVPDRPYRREAPDELRVAPDDPQVPYDWSHRDG
jgi:dTDP-4-dehydrorhamnose 3,5-epimerase